MNAPWTVSISRTGDPRWRLDSNLPPFLAEVRVTDSLDYVIYCDSVFSEFDLEGLLARARVIAAAPELLTAAKESQWFFGHVMGKEKRVDWGKTFDIDWGRVNTTLLQVDRAVHLAIKGGG